MGKTGSFLSLLLVFSLLSGCTSLREPDSDKPKTLLTWAKNENSTGESDSTEKKNQDADSPELKPNKKQAEEPLVADRPDFTEASSTVGKGRVQLESGYTYSRDRSNGVSTASHSYPEALLRVGLFADWFEFRVGQNFGNARSDSPDDVFSAGGAEDLYLGFKLGLTEQKALLPEMALVIQTQVPTGHRSLTSEKILPGANLLYGWDVIEDRLSFAGSSQANRAFDDSSHAFVELAQSLTVGYTLTKRLGAYTEWFAFFPAGAVAPGVGPQHYFNGGFIYQFTPNFQVDIRAGMGLNRSADDFFTGTGFAIRY